MGSVLPDFGLAGSGVLEASACNTDFGLAGSGVLAASACNMVSNILKGSRDPFVGKVTSVLLG